MYKKYQLKGNNPRNFMEKISFFNIRKKKTCEKLSKVILIDSLFHRKLLINVATCIFLLNYFYAIINSW